MIFINVMCKTYIYVGSYLYPFLFWIKIIINYRMSKVFSYERDPLLYIAAHLLSEIFMKFFRNILSMYGL